MPNRPSGIAGRPVWPCDMCRLGMSNGPFCNSLWPRVLRGVVAAVGRFSRRLSSRRTARQAARPSFRGWAVPSRPTRSVSRCAGPVRRCLYTPCCCAGWPLPSSSGPFSSARKTSRGPSRRAWPVRRPCLKTQPQCCRPQPRGFLPPARRTPHRCARRSC